MRIPIHIIHLFIHVDFRFYTHHFIYTQGARAAPVGLSYMFLSYMSLYIFAICVQVFFFGTFEGDRVAFRV